MVAEKEDVFLIAGTGASSRRDIDAKRSGDDLFGERRQNDCDAVFVVNARDPSLTRELKAARLQPWKGVYIRVGMGIELSTVLLFVRAILFCNFSDKCDLKPLSGKRSTDFN